MRALQILAVTAAIFFTGSCGDDSQPVPSRPTAASSSDAASASDGAPANTELSLGIHYLTLEQLLRTLPGSSWPTQHRFTVPTEAGQELMGVTASAEAGLYIFLFRNQNLERMIQANPLNWRANEQGCDDAAALRDWVLSYGGPYLSPSDMMAQFVAASQPIPTDNDVSWLKPLANLAEEAAEERDAGKRFAEILRTYDGRKVRLGMSIATVQSLFPPDPEPELRQSGASITLVYRRPLLDARWYPGLQLEIEFVDGATQSVLSIYTPGEFSQRKP